MIQASLIEQGRLGCSTLQRSDRGQYRSIQLCIVIAVTETDFVPKAAGMGKETIQSDGDSQLICAR